MSNTLKINAINVQADPRAIQWKPIEPLNGSHLGTKTLSRYRNALLLFPALTSVEFNEWASRCDNGNFYIIYMPERVDAAYAINPEFWVSTFYDFDTVYYFHFMGSRHSSGIYVYDTQILVYMARALNVSGGTG